ncbi:MAG TPA: histidine kinase [Puia sp.]
MARGLFGAGRALYFRGDFQPAIDTITLAIGYFKKLHNNQGVADAFLVLSNIYSDQGDYEKAFEMATQVSSKDASGRILSLAQIGYLYKNIGDFSSALLYYKKAMAFSPAKGEYPFRQLNHRLGELYAEEGKFDSARYFYSQALIGNPANIMIRLRLGEYFILTGRDDSALLYLTELYKDLNNRSEGNFGMTILLDIGKAYLHQRQYDQAMGFAQKAYEMASTKGARQNLRDASYLLSTIYDSLKNESLAFSYYKQYIKFKDAIITDQLKGKLYAFRRSEEEDRRVARIRGQLFLLAGSLVILLFFGLLLYSYRGLKHKNERLALKKRAADLEMQALRTQMNPHFIFNALSSINGFILKKEASQASDYLTRFSRLVRLVLDNSSKKVIPLEQELHMLRLYLEMESLRFSNRFTYRINHDGLNLSSIFVPPLILQPFCENAIWHGLLHKEGPGELTIDLRRDDNLLLCVISDNGVGRKRATSLDQEEKRESMGFRLTSERLTLFNQSSCEIEDLIQGTSVHLKIKLNDQGHYR